MMRSVTLSLRMIAATVGRRRRFAALMSKRTTAQPGRKKLFVGRGFSRKLHGTNRSFEAAKPAQAGSLVDRDGAAAERRV